jgi:asparagine synthase (glutamine-hydrolysing)
MCGIAGIISYQPPTGENATVVLQQKIARMTNSLAHRGPDGEGYWISSCFKATLGHCRLAIIDTSKQAAQPMQYRYRYSIVYNGEIYNYLELKQTLQLQGYVFQSNSDTEVIVAAYAAYQQHCVQYLDGMFAFAIWDNEEKKLFAARDRFGEKPFFYALVKNDFIFASEMKALWAYGVEKQPNHHQWIKFLSTGSMPSTNEPESTFYIGVFQLAPASYLNWQNGYITYNIYWQLHKSTLQDADTALSSEKLRQLLFDSIEKRLRSDVPVGTSLSGGLDSSCIIAGIKEIKKNDTLPTFSAIFPGFEKDESRYIEEVVHAKDLINYSVTPTADALINDLHQLCYYHEQPIASSSVYAQYRVCGLARQHGVKVLLDGQGADEVFAGYHKYYAWYWQELLAQWKWKLLLAEKKKARVHEVKTNWQWKNYAMAVIPATGTAMLEYRQLQRMRQYSFLTDNYKNEYLGKEMISNRPVMESLNDVLHYNTTCNGLGELLRYADRNAMAHGIEIRLPFLSHDMVEFAFSLPATLKIKDGYSKWILRKAIENSLPRNIVWRTDKTGYEPPQRKWMENKRLQEFIYESRLKLVHQQILTKKVLETTITPISAYHANNVDWWCLVAGILL